MGKPLSQKPSKNVERTKSQAGILPAFFAKCDLHGFFCAFFDWTFLAPAKNGIAFAAITNDILSCAFWRSYSKYGRKILPGYGLSVIQ
jgi:hypothetical protein